MTNLFHFTFSLLQLYFGGEFGGYGAFVIEGVAKEDGLVTKS